MTADSSTGLQTRPIDRVEVVDGEGVRVVVRRGQLHITDATGERAYPRAGHKLERLVIVARTGYVSLSAYHWCALLSIPIVHLGPTRQTGAVSTHGPGGRRTDDARLRRAQAFIADTPAGLAIAKDLIAEKIRQGVDTVEQCLTPGGVATELRAVDVRSARTVAEVAELESAAATVYFAAWAPVRIRYLGLRHGDVPPAWHTFGSRRSAVARRRTAQNASNPINAMLNYLYAVAESECRLACHALGLDPGLGVLHTDYRDRDSMVFDLLEVVRPAVERWLLGLLTSRTFTRADFSENGWGVCAVGPSLVHTLARTGPWWAAVVAPWAEHVTHAIARTSPRRIRLTTPLTASQMRSAQGKRAWTAPAFTYPPCPHCQRRPCRCVPSHVR